jgi:hypothetical protein
MCQVKIAGFSGNFLHFCVKNAGQQIFLATKRHKRHEEKSGAGLLMLTGNFLGWLESQDYTAGRCTQEKDPCPGYTGAGVNTYLTAGAL